MYYSNANNFVIAYSKPNPCSIYHGTPLEGPYILYLCHLDISLIASPRHLCHLDIIILMPPVGC